MTSAPTAYRLHERLFQLGAVETHPDTGPALTAEEARDAINQFLCDQAVACRCLVDGKERVLKFDALWSLAYGQKWQYVPHEARGLMTEGQVRATLK